MPASPTGSTPSSPKPLNRGTKSIAIFRGSSSTKSRNGSRARTISRVADLSKDGAGPWSEGVARVAQGQAGAPGACPRGRLARSRASRRDLSVPSRVAEASKEDTMPKFCRHSSDAARSLASGHEPYPVRQPPRSLVPRATTKIGTAEHSLRLTEKTRDPRQPPRCLVPRATTKMLARGLGPDGMARLCTETPSTRLAMAAIG